MSFSTAVADVLGVHVPRRPLLAAVSATAKRGGVPATYLRDDLADFER